MVKKAGCILVNIRTKKIALVCRNGEFSFPKGHLEKNETIRECAVRETKEEVGHNCHIVGDKEIAVLYYSTPSGEEVENYYYIAIDDGKCKELIDDENKEISIWKDVKEVYEILSYSNLKEMWNKIELKVKDLLKINV